MLTPELSLWSLTTLLAWGQLPQKKSCKLVWDQLQHNWWEALKITNLWVSILQKRSHGVSGGIVESIVLNQWHIVSISYCMNISCYVFDNLKIWEEENPKLCSRVLMQNHIFRVTYLVEEIHLIKVSQQNDTHRQQWKAYLRLYGH